MNRQKRIPLPGGWNWLAGPRGGFKRGNSVSRGRVGHHSVAMLWLQLRDADLSQTEEARWIKTTQVPGWTGCWTTSRSIRTNPDK